MRIFVFANYIREGMIIQKLKRANDDRYKLAETYYQILSSVNSLNLTKREIQLIAFAAIRESISYAHIKEEFCEKYGTSVQTINNMVSKLTRLKVFVKDNGKIKVNPVICFKFDDGIKLEITLLYG